MHSSTTHDPELQIQVMSLGGVNRLVILMEMVFVSISA